jgi:sugar lactone lactonase YvrE
MKKSHIGLATVCTGTFLALANGAQAQTIYSIDSQAGTPSIHTFNADGTQSSFLNTHDSSSNIGGIAIGSSGNLYVSSYSGNINIYSPGGVYLSTFANTGFSGSQYIVFNGAGDLFVAHSMTVTEYAPNGSSLGNVAYPSGEANDLTIDNSGNLYMTDRLLNQVWEYSNGSLVRQFRGGLNDPYGVAVNAAGQLFVANYNSGTISEFAADGSSLGTFASGLHSPMDLKFDGSGNLYEADSGTGTINEFNASGNVINTLTASDGSSPEFLAVQSVPEPTTLALAGFGGLAFLGLRRRKA